MSGPKMSLFELPMSKAADPVTSDQAAEKLKKSGRLKGQRLNVYNAVKKWPGRTSAEIADNMDIDRHTAAKRLPELRNAGYLVNGKIRKCRVCKNNCLTWFVKENEDAIEKE